MKTHTCLDSYGRQTLQSHFNGKLCGKLFALSECVRAHLLIHTGDKRFRCDICGRGFTRNGHLKRYVVIHTDDT